MNSESKSASRLLSEQYDIEFTRCVEKQELQNKLTQIISYPSLFVRKLYNSYLLLRYKEFRKPLTKNLCPMRWLNPFSTFFFNLNFAANPQMMKAILRNYRKDPEEGVFEEKENGFIFVPILQDMYPSEKVTPDDFLLSCRKNFVNSFRQPILQFIGPQSIRKHQEELEKVVYLTIQQLEEKAANGKVNATELSLVFTTNVISRLLLGHPGPYNVYRDIAYAIDYLNRYSMKKTFRQPISKEDKEKYEKSLKIVREAIDTSLTTKEKPVLGSLVDTLRQEKQMSELQIKSTLLLMYFAGSETAASLLNYLLWQLGKHPEYQEKIFQETRILEGSLCDQANSSKTLDKFFNESIRLYTPVYIIGRQLASDLICTVKDKSGKIVFQERIPKDVGLLSGVSFAARDPWQFEKPDQFNPERFENPPKTLPWLPFGDGKHSCPGQWLAKSEIIVFVTALLQKFRIESFPDKLTQKGYMTLKSGEDVWLLLSHRE